MRLLIREEQRGKNPRNGKMRVRKTDKKSISCTVGKTVTFEKGKTSFEITEVSEDEVLFVVLYAEERYNKAWKLKKGENTFYKPANIDDGYIYLFRLK